MRTAAQSVFVVFFCVLTLTFLCAPQAYAQTTQQPYIDTTNYTNTESNVPQDHHTFTQVELIDILSAAMCQLTGIDPSDPQQPCLGVNPSTGKIGFAPTQTQQFGMAGGEPQVGGAIGIMTQYISYLYIPAVNASDYVGYLADNFGISKPAYAQTAPTNCNTSNFGYGFCGLNPLLKLWSDVRDLSYALLTVLFIAIGIGVMLRFRVDPRTVMTLQNQIPRVIIAIVLITFSFAIAGALIDVMWTVTYAGINFIAQASPNTQVALCPAQPKPINQVVETRLADQPISFTNTVFRADCKGSVDSGLFALSTKVSDSMGDLAQQLVHDLLLNDGNSCHVDWFNPFNIAGCALKVSLEHGAVSVLLWFAEFLVKIIVVVAILIALFRLWFKLIQCYLTFLIFVILGPIWIVLGLIPGRPMGFEKWLRIIFANLAVFPLVAFILVFARVLTDITPSGPASPSTTFVPPLIGNPSITTFSDLMGFGAIMIAPNIPDIIKERMKAKSQSNLGAAVVGGLTAGVAASTAIPNQVSKRLNKRDQYGNAIGVLARGRDTAADKAATFAGSIPGLGWVGKQHKLNEAAKEGPTVLRQHTQAQRAYSNARRNWKDQTHPETGQQFSSKGDFDNYWTSDPIRWARHKVNRNNPENPFRGKPGKKSKSKPTTPPLIPPQPEGNT